MIFNSQIWRKLSKMRSNIQTREKPDFHPQFQIANKSPACRSFLKPRLILQNPIHPYPEVQLSGPNSCIFESVRAPVQMRGFYLVVCLFLARLGYYTIGCIPNSSSASTGGGTMTILWVSFKLRSNNV
jgi:hypothetical protein